MRPTLLLSGQVDGSVVRRPVLLGTAPTEVLGMRARYLRVTEAATITTGNNIIDNAETLLSVAVTEGEAASPASCTHRVPPLAPS